VFWLIADSPLLLFKELVLHLLALLPCPDGWQEVLIVDFTREVDGKKS